MAAAQTAAVIAAGILGMVGGYQLLLAAGLPVGRGAWGGRHRVLPPRLRWGSLAAVPVLAAAAWIVLARGGVLPAGGAGLVHAATWGFAGLFLLNTLGNLASPSAVERAVMAPATVVLTVCFVVVALTA